MKIDGEKVQGRNVETIVIPRGDDISQARVFYAQAILDYTELNTLLPAPTVPYKLAKGGVRVADPDRPNYKEARSSFEERRLAWIVITSLEATPGLEWETVDRGNPETWLNFESELAESGFSVIEVSHIVAKCMDANALNQARLDRARDQFLSFQQARLATSCSPTDDPNDSPSGAPPSDWD